MANVLSLLMDSGALGAGVGGLRKPAFRDALMHLMTETATMPQRAFESSESLRAGGPYNPGPVLEAAMLPMGTGAFGAVPRGAIGSTFSHPLYHGSPKSGLNILEESTRGPLGPGVYSSPAEQIAGHYAGQGGTLYELPQKNRDIYRGIGHKTDDEWFGFKSDKDRLVAAAEPAKRSEVSSILDKMWSGDGYPAYQRLVHLYKGDEGAQALFKRAGFEGISGLVDGPEVLLFGKQNLK